MHIFLEVVSKKPQTLNLSSSPLYGSCEPTGTSQADLCYLTQSNQLSKLLHFHAVHATK